MDSKRNLSLLKLLGVLLAGIFGLWLVYAIIFGTGSGFRMGYRGNFEGGHFYMGYGYGYGFAGTISVILLLIIKVLFVLFIAGLVVGIIYAVKNYIFTKEDVEKIKSSFTGKKEAANTVYCSICGKGLEPDWKVCPHCGKETESKNA